MTDPSLFLASQPAHRIASLGETQDHVVLLDANNLAMRSFHAAKSSMKAVDPELGHSVETGSLHLFATGLGRFLHQLKPVRFLACWDGGRSLYRESIYPKYKAARHEGHSGEPSHGPAFKLINEFLDLCGIAQWCFEGFEADDLIAAAHRIARANDPGARITIMSSDKDLLQLLDAETHQLRFSSYGTTTDIWDRQRVIAEFGYVPERIPVVMAFTGDTSDGVPGARGIGPKKAVKLLEQHNWRFASAMNSVPDSAMVMTSRMLVDLIVDDHPVIHQVISMLDNPYGIPVFEPLGRGSRNAQARLEALTEFCARYQMRQLWEGVVEGTLWP